MEKQSLDFKITQEEVKSLNPSNVININIGVLGHIDSGKTSLARSLSEVTSTASLDKNPQSQQRKITLDLGFSAFFTKIPQNNPQFENEKQKKYLQFTLVDCPGHASLIKTILGGASIIDVMFLVIDVNKGIQTQTAECLVIGELLMQKMIVILNKIDMIPEEKREETLKKKKQMLQKVFSKTKFGADVPMVEVSAALNASEQQGEHFGIDVLINKLLSEINKPKREEIEKPFLFLIDHCFPLKGQGQVVTGTVTQGKVKVGDNVFFPQLNESQKIKSIQMFRKSVQQAFQGDRIGIQFSQLDHKAIERGLACDQSAVKTIENAIIEISKINYFKFGIKSKQKYHVTFGHQTIMANIRLFSCQKSSQNPFDLSQEFEFEESYEEFKQKSDNKDKILYCLLEFEKPMITTEHSLLIGSKFDTDTTQNVCRLGFYGNIHQILDTNDLKQLKIFRHKSRQGVIEKAVDNYTVLIKDLFKKDTNIDVFVGKEVRILKTGLVGKIQGSFGKSGKCKAVFTQNVNEVTDEKGETQQIDLANSGIELFFKKYLFNKNL